MDSLCHYGILGMRWGVRRTPAQLGHIGKSKESSESSSKKKVSEMSDEELRKHIARLDMEARYSDLVKRQKERDRSVVTKLLNQALEDLGRKSLGIAVDALVNAIKKKSEMSKEEFDIKKWLETDVEDMDPQTILTVSKWYTNAMNIKQKRDSLNTP